MYQVFVRQMCHVFIRQMCYVFVRQMCQCSLGKWFAFSECAKYSFRKIARLGKMCHVFVQENVPSVHSGQRVMCPLDKCAICSLAE